MTCECGHLRSDHATLTDKPYDAQECFKCKDCMKFSDNTHRKPKISEACEWDSHEHCFTKDSNGECECPCHLMKEIKDFEPHTIMNVVTGEIFQKE